MFISALGTKGAQDAAVRASGTFWHRKDEPWDFRSMWGMTKLGLVALSERGAGEGHLGPVARCGHRSSLQGHTEGLEEGLELERGCRVSPGTIFLKFPSKVKGSH